LFFQSEPDGDALKDASIMPSFVVVASLAVGLAQTFWPKTFDLYLYAFDRSLAITPGALINSWFKALPSLSTLATGTYAYFLLLPSLYRAWAVHRGIGREPSVLRSFLVAALLSFVFNQCCPAVGPRYTFPGAFPHLPELRSLTVAITAVAGSRNAMPSLEATTVFLIWWSAWRLGWPARVVATLIVPLTLLAALASGEHYLIDLIVAVPFTLGVEGLCRRGYLAAGVGLGLTLAWFILLRSDFFPHTPTAGWILVAVTTLVCVVMQIPLYRGQHTEEGLALSTRLTAMTTARLASREVID
jgi:hypothetical protein